MLNDIYPSVFDNSFHPRAPQKGDVVFLYSRNSVAVCAKGCAGGCGPEGAPGETPSVPVFPALDVTIDDFLFYVDEKAFFGRYIQDPATCPLEGYSFIPLRETFSMQPAALPFEIATGYHIVSWRRYHHFCGVCGTPLVPSEKERALVCPQCHHTIYPDIHPAVNIAIRNGDKLLLIKNTISGFPRYSLVAGFIEIGETAEDTVRRESMEEVGLKVKNIRYFGSQPWGIVGNLQIGFYCDVDGSDEIRVDGNEVKEALWFKRSEIPPRDTTSITGALIEAFRRGEI